MAGAGAACAMCAVPCHAACMLPGAACRLQLVPWLLRAGTAHVGDSHAGVHAAAGACALL